jgi:ribosomal protein S18 acetylase RimI-like enzyme
LATNLRWRYWQFRSLPEHQREAEQGDTPIPPIQIRRLDTEDIDDYRRIRLQALTDTPDAFSSTYEIEAARPIAELADRLTSSNVFGAYYEGQIVGIVGFKQQTGQKEAHKGVVWGMYVQPEARSRGVGEALIRTMLQLADALVEQLTLAVAQGNDTAVTLYRKHCFEVYGVEPKALKGPAGYSDNVLMVRLRPCG